MKSIDRSARAPPHSPLVSYQNGTKIKKIKRRKSRHLFFAMYIIAWFPDWVFSPFSPEMYKIIAKSDV